MLATLAPLLPSSGMSDDLLSDTPPKPQAGRDLEGQRILDRIRSRVFGVETGPTRLGRWQLGRKLGKGAMGTVYAAYDPELDRNVAIKVLHGMSPEAEHARRLRLRREAQAMARVDHPNLVHVYDVCADAPQPYVVMELVEGETLRVWQERPEHTWRELITAYLGAARGLAALHRARLIHRDFKPDNALRDQSGRVRVVDFGLVFADGREPASHGPRGPALTRDGALVGTLAYMAPEQLMGGRADACSDQFSLCRSLYEAIYRARPFVGDDPESLLADMRDKPPPLAPNPRRAPRWLGAQILRGLALDPQRRFKSMDELVDTLEEALRRRPLRNFATVATLVALAAGALVTLRGGRPCGDLEDHLVGAWDERQEPEIRAAFLAQALPEGARQWTGLSATMHDNRQRWLELREETCKERRVRRPAVWTLQRDRCLDEVRLVMQGISHGYRSPTPADILLANEAAAKLALRLADCGRIGPLGAGPLPPDLTPRLEGSLAVALAEQLAGRLGRAEMAARRALEAAERTSVPAAVAEGLHRLGRVLGHERRSAPALDALDAAAREAVRIGHDRLYVDARLFAAKLRVLDFGLVDRAEQDAADADDFIARLDGQGADTLGQTAELHEVRGFIARDRRDYDTALEHFSRALDFHRLRLGTRTGQPIRLPCRLPDPATDLELDANALSSLDVVRTLHNLALVLSDRAAPTDRVCTEQLYRTGLAAAEASFGQLHPVTLDLRNDLALWLRDLARDQDALTVLQPSLEAVHVQFGARSTFSADHLLVLATIALDNGDFASAGTWAARASALYAEQCNEHGCPPNYGNALTVQGEHAKKTGDLARALALYQAALVPLAQAGADVQHADGMLLVAETLVDLGREAEARDWLDRALPSFMAQGRRDDPYLLNFLERFQPQPPTETDHALASHRPNPRPI